MADPKKYDHLAISKKASQLIRAEAKKNRRMIYVEAEMLLEEAVTARRKDEKK